MRKSKVMSATEAIKALVTDSCRELAVGGMHMHNNPMALIRELINQEKQVEKLVTSPSACINADLLLGTGLVKSILTSYVGFEHLGLPPHFRKKVQSKEVKLWECDEPMIVYGLQAGSSGLPFIPYPKGLELNDIPKINPTYYKTTTDPYSGEEVMTCPAIKPEVAFVHCQYADEFGNAIFKGSVFTDRQMIFAADKVILQVEKVVSTEELHSMSSEATVPGFLVDAVVEAPYGCHPTSSHGIYNYDQKALLEYLKASKSSETFSEYLNKYVKSESYEDAVGKERLAQLARGEGDK